MIHIGYGDSATGCIKEAIASFDLPGNNAFPSRDNFTCGPISKCLAKNGSDQRIEFWDHTMKTINYEMFVERFYNSSLQILDDISDSEITLWQGDSCHDILATAWLLEYFSDREIEWSIIDLIHVSPDDLNEGFPPVNVAMFKPEQLPQLYSYCQKIGKEAIEMYRTLWRQMTFENGSYRIFENNQLFSVRDDHYDSFILSCLNEEWQSHQTITSAIIKKSKHSISDTIIQYRMVELMKNKHILLRGALFAEDCEVKLI